MKCVRWRSDLGGHVARIEDDIAEREVKAGRATYAPKHWLRAAKNLEASGAADEHWDEA